MGLFDTDENLPRAQRKRMGLPVNNNPYDFTTSEAMPEQPTPPTPPAQSNQSIQENSPVGINPDDYTFTEKGLVKGISIGEAKRLAGVNDTTPTPNTQPTKFEGNSWDDLEKYIKDRLDYHKSLEESEEDRRLREKRERRDSFIAGLGDALSTFNKAYSYAAGVEPMDTFSASSAMRERFDKAKAERDRNSDRILHYLSELDRLNGRKAEASYRQERLKQYQQQQDRLDRLAEAKVEADVAKVEKFNSDKEIKQKESEVKIELMQAGVEEKKASAKAKLIVANSQAYKNYMQGDKAARSGNGSSGGRHSNNNTSTNDGYEVVTEKTDARGRKTTTRKYKQRHQPESPTPSQNRNGKGTPAGSSANKKTSKKTVGTGSSGGKYTNTRNLGL